MRNCAECKHADYCSPTNFPCEYEMSDADIVVTINHGLKDYSIELIQEIEKRIDTSLIPVGFTRTETSKCNSSVEIWYKQFGKASL